jgi:predicted CoA-binding protein
MKVRERIDDFLKQKRIAFVGVSREPEDFSRKLYADLRQRGYNVVPVNPSAADIEGVKCYARVQDIQPGVDGALIMTSADRSDQIVRDCAAARVPRVWLYRAAGRGAVTPSAVEICVQNGIRVVPGYCPYMFLPKTQFFHRMHGWFTRVE